MIRDGFKKYIYLLLMVCGQFIYIYKEFDRQFYDTLLLLYQIEHFIQEYNG